VFSYNCEVWNITETEIALMGRNEYLIRRLVGEIVKCAENKILTKSQLLEMLGLDSIQALIRKRKLQWVAHCAGRRDKDLTWKRMVREIEDGDPSWLGVARRERKKQRETRNIVEFHQ